MLSLGYWMGWSCVVARKVSEMVNQKVIFSKITIIKMTRKF